MPYQITWYHPHRILITQYWGILDVNILLNAQHDTQIMMETATHTVHTIIDVAKVTLFDLRLGDIRALLPLPDEKHGWFLICGLDQQFGLMNHVITLIPNLDIKILPQQSDAFDFLAHTDPSLGEWVHST